jgi:hypothetical protein
MKREVKKMSLPRALLAGVLCGIITALAVLLYTLFYRKETGFENLSIIGPVPIFVSIPLLLVIAGGIYFIMVHYIRKGEILFIVMFAAILFTGIAMDINFHPETGSKLFSAPNGLLFGIELISGLAICIFLPYLAHHPSIYMTPERLKWED